MSKKEVEIKQHFIKNSDFRTIFSTGIYGGVTLNGLIDINFLIDRVTIPTEATLSINENTQEAKETSKKTKEGVVREVQVGVMMDIETAKKTVEWLNRKIKVIEDAKPKK